MLNDIAEKLVKQALRKGVKTPEDLQKLKNQWAGQFKISSLPNFELIKAYRKLIQKGAIKENKGFGNLLRKRGVRTISGVAPVAVLTKPYPCPGKCIFCPSEKGMPKSYLSNEPAVMRAILNDFDPFRQVIRRIKTLENAGHDTSKIELIIMGGTFSFYPRSYQTAFIRACFNGLNQPYLPAQSLEKAQKINQKALHRCVGLTLETRPDFVTKEELKRFRNLGCTRIEIGVQSLDDKILKLNRRGHEVAQTIEATRLIKDAGFKLCYHLMPNLPGSSLEKDFKMFQEVFKNPDFRPDHLKIYPCVVTKDAQIAKWWSRGEFKPYSDEELTRLLIRIKKIVPPYVRIIRVVRDIPAESILAGSKISNLRQLLQEYLKKHSEFNCHCIRCREIKEDPFDLKNLEFKKLEYKASSGLEFFLSYETPKTNRLCSLLRLRFPSQAFSRTPTPHFIKELEGTSVIREVHTYGRELALEARQKNAPQHLGLGKKLVQKAEEISRKSGFKKIAVISAIGTRPYYQKLGYHLSGTYLVKKL